MDGVQGVKWGLRRPLSADDSMPMQFSDITIQAVKSLLLFAASNVLSTAADLETVALEQGEMTST
jgi:hypothetical protein